MRDAITIFMREAARHNNHHLTIIYADNDGASIATLACLTCPEAPVGTVAKLG